MLHNPNVALSLELSKTTKFLLGDKEFLSNEEYYYIIKSGIAHLFAISGLHIGIIAFLIFKISKFSLAYLNITDNPHKYSIPLVIISIFLYVDLINYPISATRSLLIISFYLIFIFFDYKILKLNSLILAAIIILTVNYKYLFNAGFQLSFSATFALIYYFEISKKIIRSDFLLTKFIDSIKNLIVISLLTFLATFPIILYHFNHISTYGILANIIAVPYFSFIVLPFTILSYIIYMLFDTTILIGAAYYLLNILIKFAKWIANLPYSYIFLNHDILSVSILYLAIISAILLRLAPKTPYIIIILTLLYMGNLKQDSYDAIIEDNLIIIKNQDEYLIAEKKYNIRKAEFLNNKYNNPRKYNLINFESKNLSCADKICFFKKNLSNISLIYKSIPYSEFRNYCKTSDLIVDFANNNLPCSDTFIISSKDIYFKGPYKIKIDDKLHIYR